jgi:hypothetical protein
MPTLCTRTRFTLIHRWVARTLAMLSRASAYTHTSKYDFCHLLASLAARRLAKVLPSRPSMPSAEQVKGEMCLLNHGFVIIAINVVFGMSDISRHVDGSSH